MAQPAETIDDAVPEPDDPALPGMLAGVRVVEVADETAEYVGLILAGLGAEILKVEQVSNTKIRGKATFGIE